MSQKAIRAWNTYVRRMRVMRKARSAHLRADRECRYALERFMKIREEEKTDGE